MSDIEALSGKDFQQHTEQSNFNNLSKTESLSSKVLDEIGFGKRGGNSDTADNNNFPGLEWKTNEGNSFDISIKRPELDKNKTNKTDKTDKDSKTSDGKLDDLFNNSSPEDLYKEQNKVPENERKTTTSDGRDKNSQENSDSHKSTESQKLKHNSKAEEMYKSNPKGLTPFPFVPPDPDRPRQRRR